MRTTQGGTLSTPLYSVLGTIAGLWTLVSIGYYIILPILGFELSYNSAPIVIAIYYIVWAVISILYFWKLFSRWLIIDSRIWRYAVLSLLCAEAIWILLYILTLFPALEGPLLTPYTDIIFATPWYFLPKSTEVLVQQILITILVLEMYYRFHTLKNVILGYAICFGGAHVLLFMFLDAPTPYALIITISAFLSSFVFPYLILRVRAGFIYSYVIHLLFYILLAMALHTWPPFGYIGAY